MSNVIHAAVFIKARHISNEAGISTVLSHSRVSCAVCALRSGYWRYSWHEEALESNSFVLKSVR